MKWRSINYLLGSVLLYLAFAMLIPLLWAMWEKGAERLDFSMVVVLTICTAWLLLRAGEPPAELRREESFAFVTIAWLLVSLFSALPYYFAGSVPTMIDAYFEAMSGFTTTGATVIASVEQQPQSILLWRALTHWLGGMGIIVLFVAVFPRLGVSGALLVQAETPGPLTQTVTPGIANSAKVLWLIYTALTAAQTIILNAVGFSFFDALTHAFATMATGGFSTKNASVAGFANPAAEWVIAFFMLLAGVNFALYYYLLLGRVRRVFKDEELRFYLKLVVVATLLLVIFLLPLDYGPQAAFRHAVFQVSSVVTTTGFASTDFDRWPEFARLLLLLLMFVGGCGGSTAGGLKQIRILVVGKYLLRELRKAVRPWEITPVRVGEQVISRQLINRIVAFVCLYLFIFICAVLYLTSLGYDLTTACSAAASAQGNIGPGLAAVGPMHTYAPLAPGAKVCLTLLMLIGRLEIFTVFSFLLPASSRRKPVWRKGKRHNFL
ncbi:MAG TPA: potassium transporter [Firmicutes bacterium]|jgi:trk system potassium uptake protein TrkH|nr:TrkH family potassium uptake protein [Bacillota bacterium]HAA37464.1 potassium transporter [Bacillota bacterium]